MLYESEHSLREDYVKIQGGENYSFPPHLHGSFELISVTEGSLCVKVNAHPYEIGVGEAVLIFPNQVHELISLQPNRHFLCIFSPQMVHAYSRVFLSSVPESALFRPTPFYLEALQRAAEEQMGSLALKGILYSLCAEFDRSAVYRSKNGGREGLLSEIFRFVEKNHGSECTLCDLAAHTSYHYVYLSHLFKQYTGFSFTEYVTRYRVAEACYMLQSGEGGVLSVALSCGFNSLRSFNRNFKQITGKTPLEYRRMYARASALA